MTDVINTKGTLDINTLNLSPDFISLTTFLIGHPKRMDGTADEADTSLCLELIKTIPKASEGGFYSLHYDSLSFALVVTQRLNPDQLLTLFQSSFVSGLHHTMHPVTVQIPNARFHLMMICIHSYLLSPLINPAFIREHPVDSPYTIKWMQCANGDLVVSSIPYVQHIMRNMDAFTHSNFLDNFQSLSASLLVLTFSLPESRPHIDPLLLHHWQIGHFATVENEDKLTRQLAYCYYLLTLKSSQGRGSEVSKQQKMYAMRLREEGFDSLAESVTPFTRWRLDQNPNAKLVQAVNLLCAAVGMNMSDVHLD
ncbi:hypothetical protein BLNAU_2811 [Blattamonas nauphoetae]|uniref:Uncharacterized protein n=1 Tax=Blattamonas nauphoetae TaxID=2049346 RepID=A0ABQ9YEU6_9EUKA|nr:hypothetical protein BLNAU_2811 [Blattamonas nauphoetae]